jgi:mutator protein MutT
LERSREYPQAPVVGVGAIVIDDEDRILLVRRSHAPLLGQWSVPGGKVELGERLKDAVKREVREETGLSVVPLSILKALDRIETDDAGRVRFHYVLVDFLCRPESADAIPHAASDASDARWVPLAGLAQSKEFVLPAWTLEVVDLGRQNVRTNGTTKS